MCEHFVSHGLDPRAPNRGKIPAIDAALGFLVAVIFSFIAVLEEISSNADRAGIQSRSLRSECSAAGQLD